MSEPRWAGRIGLSVAAVVVAGVTVGGIRTHELAASNDKLDHSLSSFETGALSTARGYAATFATYRYDSFAADVAATEAHAVDPFLSQYRRYTTQLKSGIVQLRARSSAKLISAGLVSVSSSSAVVDLFLDQTIVNTKGSQLLTQRIEMTMVRPHGRWLISRVRIFST